TRGAADVRAHERGSRVPGDEPPERREERVEAGKPGRAGVAGRLRRPEVPVRGVVELLPALVRGVERLEKSAPVGEGGGGRGAPRRGARRTPPGGGWGGGPAGPGPRQPSRAGRAADRRPRPAAHRDRAPGARA